MSRVGFIFIGLLWSGQLVQGQDLIFEKRYDDHSLKEVIRDIEEHFNIRITYLNKLVEKQKLTGTIQAREIDSALIQALSQTKLTYNKLHEMIVISKAKRVNTLKGIIKDSDGAPLFGANIWFPGDLTGAVTNDQGAFELVLEEGIHDVVVSCMGFRSLTKRIDTSEKQEINIVLETSPIELKTVEISANSFDIGSLESNTVSITKMEILHTPAPFRGVFRTLKVLPGYSNDDISAKARIRGGHWDETAVYLDNLEIYEPFHLEEVEGLAGIFETDLIQQINVKTGGFGGRYTDKLSGIIDMSTPEYLSKSETSMSVDFLAAKIQTQQNLGDHGNLMFSGRRGYLDLILDTEDEGINPTYFDFFLKYNRRIGDKHTVSFDALYAQDDILFERDPALIRQEFYNSHRKNLFLWTNWKWLKSDQFQSHWTIGYQSLVKDSDFAFESSLIPNNIDNRDTKIFSAMNRSYLERFDGHSIEFGVEIKAFDAHYLFNEVRIKPSVPDESFISTQIIDLNSAFNGWTFGIYAQDSWSPSPKMQVQVGSRFSGQSFTKGLQVAPRVIVTHEIGNALKASATYGKYYQPDNFQKLRSYDGQERPDGRPGEVDQLILGFTHSRNQWTTTFNIYHKDYKTLNDDYRFDFYNRASLGALIETPFHTVSGKSRGVEVYSRLKAQRHLFSLSYSWSKSHISNAFGETTARDFDRRHSLAANAIFEFRNNFILNAVWNFYSGGPYTPSQIAFVGEPRFNSDAIIYYDFGPKNSARLPAYHSLDLKIEKTFTFKKTSFNFYLSILNLYDRVNVRNFTWNYDGVSENGINRYRRASINGPEFFVSPGLKLSF